MFNNVDNFENVDTVEKGRRQKTRLTYNCAHLRLTKESLTVEFANKNV